MSRKGSTAAAAAVLVLVVAGPAQASILGSGPVQVNESMTGGDIAADRFGSAFAWGDFDASGDLDLAVGHPSDEIGDIPLAGAVTVLYDVVKEADGLVWDHSQRLHWDRGDMPAEAGVISTFGTSLAAGDIDSDGGIDLMVGAPGDDVDGIVDAGSVTVYFNGVGGDLRDPVFISQDRIDSPVDAATGNNFGQSLAVGRLHPFHLGELVVGAPGEAHGGRDDAGGVHILHVTEAQTTFEDALWRGNGLPGSPATNQRVGHAVAVGHLMLDFGLSGMEITIGAPTFGEGNGRVYVKDHLNHGGDDVAIELFQGVDGTPTGVQEAGDLFGASLAVGNLWNTNDVTELAVGAPFEDSDATGGADVGEVAIFAMPIESSITGRRYHQDIPGVASTNSVGDRFGSALAVGGLDGEGAPDLVVTVPGENVTVDGTTFGDAGGFITLQNLTEDSLDVGASDLYHRTEPAGPTRPSEQCGFAVTAFNASPNTRDEVFLGCPTSVVDGELHAGNVLIF